MLDVLKSLIIKVACLPHRSNSSIELLNVLILSVLLIPGSNAFSATLPVPAQYPTIQAGLDAAAPGDTVLVAAGVYNEQLVVATPVVTLLGSGRPLTQSKVPTLSVNADSANIVGFDFRGTTVASGTPTAWLGGHGFRVDECAFNGGFAAVSVIGQGEILRSERGMEFESSLAAARLFSDNAISSIIQASGLEAESCCWTAIRFHSLTAASFEIPP
jgi:hypothetical protein